jgi:hypothetical protein
MKQVTLQIPDKEYDFFLNLFKKFGSIKIKEADFIVADEHKELVRNRIATAKESDYISWDDAKKML